MKYIDEFRDPALARSLLARIAARSTRPVRLTDDLAAILNVPPK